MHRWIQDTSVQVRSPTKACICTGGVEHVHARAVSMHMPHVQVVSRSGSGHVYAGKTIAGKIVFYSISYSNG